MFSRKKRPSFLRRVILPLLGLSILIWIIGFFVFIEAIPRQTEQSAFMASTKIDQFDAIIVLTGGVGRLDAGLNLLAQGKAKKLFISGVHKGVEMRELLRLSRQSPDKLDCCITLGYDATNTYGNAQESAKWITDHNYKNLLLVTSNYHMVRAQSEFGNVLNEQTIYPYAVFPNNIHINDWYLWSGSAWLLAWEYNKYIMAQLGITKYDIF